MGFHPLFKFQSKDDKNGLSDMNTEWMPLTDCSVPWQNDAITKFNSLCLFSKTDYVRGKRIVS